MESSTGQPGDRRALARRPAASRSRWWLPRRGAALRIAALYAVIGWAWVAFSDRAVDALVRDPALRERAQTAKGWLFVLATALLLVVLVRWGERRVRGLASEVRATIDSMADGVLVVDQRSCIVETNRAAVALLGVSSKAEILGSLERWGQRFELRSADGAPLPIERYAAVRALAGERGARYDAIVRRGDGRDVYVSVASSPVVRSRTPSLAVTILRDISAHRRLEEMREEFLSTAAHEFKTPLAVIKAYAQLLQRREASHPLPLAVIQRQVDRLNRLVQDLLDTSRLRLESAEASGERFDLAALAREVVDRMRSSAPQHRLEVDAPAPVPVRADRERIGRVITSLVDNAIRFSPGGGRVRTQVEAGEGVALVSIADRGLGIPLERQAQVFERFYRAHAGTADDHGGLGLGLEMSREVVEREGGRMWFESTPGQGSTFHFGIPLAGGTS